VGIKGHNVQVISQLHAQYGPVVRIAPNELSYNTATAWRTIYGHRGSAEEMQKDLNGAGLTRPPNGQHGILTADRENHARMRRLISHAFSEKALREQEGFLQQYVDLLIKGLKEHVDKPQNMLSWYNWYAPNPPSSIHISH
jgi:cytochrome P450